MKKKNKLNKNILKFAVAFSQISSLLTFSVAQAENSINSKYGGLGFQSTIENSTSINKVFNSVFSEMLKSNDTLKNNDVKNYLLNLPLSSKKINIDQSTIESCIESLKTIKDKKDFASEYCEIQSSALNSGFENLDSVSNLMSPSDTEEILKSNIENLKKQDTLAVIVPGIFGEFINQTAFGEVFESDKSIFAQQFKTFLDRSDIKNDELRKTKRFFLKNKIKDQGYDEQKELVFETQVDISRWIRVASIDDDRQAIAKIAVLGLEPMSLESLGGQSGLSLLYTQRLNQFFQLYKKMNGKVPDRIILIGYSRGTPIALEMLNLLTDKNYRPNAKASSNELINREIIFNESQEWAKNISAQVSLGGVIYGSALADANVYSTKLRSKSPFKIKLIQNIKDFIFNIQVLNQRDLDEALEALKIAGQKGYKDMHSTNNDQVEISKAALKKIEPLKNKIIKNFIVYSGLLTKINLDIKSAPLREQDELIKSLDDLNQKYSEFKSTQSEVDDVLSHVDLVSISKVKRVLLKYAVVTNALFTQVVSTLNQSSKYEVNAMEMQSFTQKMMENFGLNEVQESIQKGISDGDVIKTLKGLNHFTKYFKTYFQAAWVGITELSTDSRLNWMIDQGKSLPESVRYYSVLGVLAPEQSQFYKSGIGYVYNESSDQKFLNKSYNDFIKVGDDDGLGLAYKGTALNDSQVDWHKTVLWPELTRKLTGKNLNTKIITFTKTHHWGLALPVAFQDKDKKTGEEVRNPFPRTEFLKSLLISITNDLNTSEVSSSQENL